MAVEAISRNAVSQHLSVYDEKQGKSDFFHTTDGAGVALVDDHRVTAEVNHSDANVDQNLAVRRNVLAVSAMRPRLFRIIDGT